MYSREIDEFTHTFGVSGKLAKNTLLMFDYETESLWSAISGKSVEGAMEGKRLSEIVSAQKITWKEWQKLHPDTKVLSYHGKETTGYDNYMDYHSSWVKTGIFPVENRDNRLKPKTTVIALDIDGKQKVYPLDLFKKTKIILDNFQGLPLLFYHDNSTNNTIVYNRKLSDVTIEFNELKVSKFQRNGNDIVGDKTTSGKWDLKTGKAIEGSLKGKFLKKVDFKKVYWFIWADYYQESEIYKQSL